MGLVSISEEIFLMQKVFLHLMVGTQVTGNYNGKDIGEIWGYRTDRLYQNERF